MTLPINKTVIEKTKTAIIFAAVVFGLGFYVGNHYAHKNAVATQQTILTAVHAATTSKQ